MNEAYLTRHHISAKVYSNYLFYLRKYYPHIDIVNLCNTAGLSFDYLTDEKNWVSIVFDQKFTELCLERTGNKNLCLEVGKASISEEVLGKIISLVFRYKNSLRSAYVEGIKYVEKFNTLLKVSILSDTPGKIAFKFNFDLTTLTSEERNSLVTSIPNIIENSKGFLAGLPRLFSLPEGRVTQTVDSDPNTPSFVINVSYQRINLTYETFGIFGSVILWACVEVVSYSTEMVRVAIILRLFTLAVFLVSIARFFRSRTDQHVSYLEELSATQDAQHKHIQLAKETIEKQLRESELITKLVSNLSRSTDSAEIYNQTCTDIVEKVGYDRCIIFFADVDAGLLRYQCSRGYSNEEQFRNFSLQINIEDSDKKRLANVYRYFQPLHFEETRPYISTLSAAASERTIIFDSTSFIAVPISSGKERHGILCVDYFRTPQTLTEWDLSLMVKVSNQLALALDRDKAIKASATAKESAAQIKSDFLAVTSHELKTPIHGIIGITESLIHGVLGPLSSAQIEDLQLVLDSGRRLSRLVNLILDYKKFQNQEQHLSIKSVNIESLVRYVCRLHQSVAMTKKLDLITDIPSDIGAAYADQDTLIQILHNLLDNAIKYTNFGRITVRLRRLGETVQLSVIDTGIGIPTDRHKDIFESFKQLNSPLTRQYDGVGLGLSIVKKLVESNNGLLTLISQENKGSEFNVVLPASIETPSQDSTGDPYLVKDTIQVPQIRPSSIEINSIPQGSADLPLILVVDDDHINLRVIKTALTGRYNLILVENGTDALMKLEAGLNPDIILLDVMMPGLNGFQVCKKIREKYADTELPIMFLTALKDEEGVSKGFEVGGNEYIRKPFGIPELLARINALLEKVKYDRAVKPFVPNEILQLMGNKRVTDIRVGDSRRLPITNVFCDLRGFTSFSESMDPLDVLAELNYCFSLIVPIVYKYKGWVDNFVGDGIFVCFANETAAALTFALEAQKVISSDTHRSTANSKRLDSLVIGIATGPTLIAWLGTKDRMHGTVISNDVNLASRYETNAKQFDCKIIVSEEIIKEANVPEADCRPLGLQTIRGFKTQFVAYEVFSSDPDDLRLLKKSTKPIFNEAVDHFVAGDYKEALTLFDEILNKSPSDGASKRFLQLCHEHLKNDDSWNRTNNVA